MTAANAVVLAFRLIVVVGIAATVFTVVVKTKAAITWFRQRRDDPPITH
jgi:hypothetical protein